MKLSDRIRVIILENDLKQKDFAKSIGVTESYISKLLKNESGLSKSTASLIAERYGYSVDWILNGTEPKMSQMCKAKNLTPIQKKLIADIEQMNTNELELIKTFINSMAEYKKSFNITNKK